MPPEEIEAAEKAYQEYLEGRDPGKSKAELKALTDVGSAAANVSNLDDSVAANIKLEPSCEMVVSMAALKVEVTNLSSPISQLNNK